MEHAGRSLNAFVVVVLAGALSLAVGTTAASATGTSNQTGVYLGPGARASVRAYETWLGRNVSWAVDFLGRSNWNDIDYPNWLLDRWQDSPYRLVLSVPMLTGSGGSLEAGATGAYNDHFRKLAKALVTKGFANAVVRLGWEFNGDWYPWFAGRNPGAFVAYWRQIVGAMRAVPGQSFAFDWTANAGSSKMPADRAYPGDGYVDIVGLDSYDQDWGLGWQVARTRWQNIVSQSYGLQWQVDFASRHGKRPSLPEWGLYIRSDGHGGGDDPYYIQQMSKWLAGHDYVYAAYFEYDAADGRHALTGGSFPNGAAAFRSLFGPAATAGTNLREKAPTPHNKRKLRRLHAG